MSKIRKLLDEVLASDKECSFYAEFSGILTLDLPNDLSNKRNELYKVIEKGTHHLTFSKVGILDTVWAVNCENVATKAEAIENVLEFLADAIPDCKIEKISVALSLSLTYLHSKHSLTNMTDTVIVYSLYKDGTCLLEEHLEPSYPIIANWNKRTYDWDEVNYF